MNQCRCWLTVKSCHCDYSGSTEEDRKKLEKQVKKQNES